LKIPQHPETENNIVVDVNSDVDVLAFVDYFFIDHGLSSQASRLRIERLLKVMPRHIIKQKEITTWIRKNWDKKLY
jgi:hypothetical protein